MKYSTKYNIIPWCFSYTIPCHVNKSELNCILYFCHHTTKFTFSLPYHTKYHYAILHHTEHWSPYNAAPYQPHNIKPYHLISYNKMPLTREPSVTCVMWHGMVMCHMCCDNIRLHTVLHTIPYHTIPYHTTPYHAIPSTRAERPTPLPYHIRGRLERTLSRIKKGRPDLSWGKETDWGNKTQKRFCNRQIILTFLEFWIVL